MCAATGITSCAERAVSDSGTVADAGPADGSEPPDARPIDAGTPQVQVKVMIAGGGSVLASVGAECDSGTCTYSVDKDTQVTLTAVDHGANRFKEWGGACTGGNRTCQFTASASVTTASATFDHH